MTQATSPFFAPEAFWCIETTMRSAMSRATAPRVITPYHVHVPSFGEWGFVMATNHPVSPADLVPDVPVRFLDEAAATGMLAFPADLGRRDVEVNRLEDAALARYYERGWRSFR